MGTSISDAFVPNHETPGGLFTEKSSEYLNNSPHNSTKMMDQVVPKTFTQRPRINPPNNIPRDTPRPQSPRPVPTSDAPKPKHYQARMMPRTVPFPHRGHSRKFKQYEVHSTNPELLRLLTSIVIILGLALLIVVLRK